MTRGRSGDQRGVPQGHGRERSRGRRGHHRRPPHRRHGTTPRSAASGGSSPPAESSFRSRTGGPRAATSASPPSSPTSAGGPTSTADRWPTASTPRLWTGSTTMPATAWPAPATRWPPHPLCTATIASPPRCTVTPPLSSPTTAPSSPAGTAAMAEVAGPPVGVGMARPADRPGPHWSRRRTVRSFQQRVDQQLEGHRLLSSWARGTTAAAGLPPALCRQADDVYTGLGGLSVFGCDLAHSPVGLAVGALRPGAEPTRLRACSRALHRILRRLAHGPCAPPARQT